MLVTVEQVEKLAPDPGSAKNGRALASERKWTEFGRQGEALWGLCKGSGAKPYQVRIDLSGPAYKCSCPSFKIPCKHSLGLMFLYAGNPVLFATETPCEFLTEWLDERRKRAEQRAQKQAKSSETPVEAQTLARREAAQVKRVASREEKVAGGISELSLFLKDIVREGLAGLPGKPYSFWDGVSKRLVDAQAPGLSRQVAELGSLCSSGTGWQERAAHCIARLHLACEAWGRIDTLPLPTQADLRAFIGFSIPQEELLAEAGVTDTWYVLAQQITDEDRLRLARTWLWSDSGRAAILYQFAFANQPLEIKLLPRNVKQAEIVFFPGSVPLRAVLKNSITDVMFRRPAGLPGIDAMLADFAGRLALNPWLERHPYLLDAVIPVCRDGQWFIQDPAGAANSCALPVTAAGVRPWRMLAASGGHPIAVFGEWNGELFEPLAAIDANAQLVALAEEGPVL